MICDLNLYFAQKLLRKAKFANLVSRVLSYHLGNEVDNLLEVAMLQTPKDAQKFPGTIEKGLVIGSPDNFKSQKKTERTKRSLKKG